MAVLAVPSVLMASAECPKAVLLKPPNIPDTISRACVPPAVLNFASLAVGLQPGRLHVGWPQLGVMVSRSASPTTVGTRRANGFMASSVRRVIPAKNEGMAGNIH